MAYELSEKYNIVIFGGPAEIDMANDIEAELKNLISRHLKGSGERNQITQNHPYLLTIPLIVDCAISKTLAIIYPFVTKTKQIV